MSVDNVLYLADSYKITHHNQYPPGTTHVYSYFESRGGKYAEVCFFGLQYILKKWMIGSVVNHEMISEAKEFYYAHFGNTNVFNEEGWRYIVDTHKGRIPLRIKAVPEGTVVPTRNVLFTVENTDPKVPWLTNWFETLLVQCWYPMTVCTNSRSQKEVIAKFMSETCDSLAGLHFKLHDFGYRGSTSVESAGIGGAAHLVNFCGTDTIAALIACKKFYSCEMAGFSIPASEHSTITAWRKDGEVDAFRNMLHQYPTGVISVVSDSYDIFNAVASIWGGELRQEVIARGGRGGGVVIRPDSGDPVTVVLKILELLEKAFADQILLNKKGYKQLPSFIRIIQGDGINRETVEALLTALKNAGWSADNLVFGTGGALLQKLDRDTLKCAFKCSRVIVNGEPRDVCKDPLTDSGKTSKRGILTLHRVDDTYVTKQCGTGDPNDDELVTVFEDGRLLVDYTLEEIRNRAELKLVRTAKHNGSNGIAAHAE